MKASTAAIGVLTDPPLVAAASAITIMTALLLLRLLASPPSNAVLWALGGGPLAIALCALLALSGARGRVVKWLASLPFPVDNVNALLNGVGQNLRLTFRASMPSREELNAALEAVHEDCFALEFHEDEPEVEVRIGVLDSKVNPARSSYRRYCRARAIVSVALLPLLDKHPIASVRIC